MFLQAVINRLELFSGLILLSEQQYFIVTGIQLRNRSVHITEGVLLSLKLALADPHNTAGYKGSHRDDQKSDAGHQFVDGKHHPQSQNQGKDSADHLGKALLERIGYRLHVVGDTAQYVAETVGVKIPDRQAADLVLNLVPQIVHGVLNRVSQAERAYDLGNRLRKINSQKHQQYIANHFKMNAGALCAGGHICQVRGQPAGNHSFNPRRGCNRSNTDNNHKNRYK